MTTITVNLPDGLFEKAKLAGFDEKSLTDTFNDFLEKQLDSQLDGMATTINKKMDKNWEDDLPPITKKYLGYFSNGKNLKDKEVDELKYQYLIEKHGAI